MITDIFVFLFKALFPAVVIISLIYFRANRLNVKAQNKLEDAESAAQIQRLDAYIDKCKKYAPVLVRKRGQLVYKDDYGDIITSKWEKELRDFALEKLGCCEEDIEILLQGLDVFVVECAKQVEQSDYDPNCSGIEYEHFCADALRELGWIATVSQASNDQGVDIVAEKEGVKVAIQCKKYSSPVGNKAVQEVYGGKPFYDAHYAVVVTNNSYTPSAQTLANATGVYLMHHDSLSELDRLVYT